MLFEGYTNGCRRAAWSTACCRTGDRGHWGDGRPAVRGRPGRRHDHLRWREHLPGHHRARHRRHARRSPTSPSSECRTGSSASARRPGWCSGRAHASPRTRFARPSARWPPGSAYRGMFISWPNCPATPPERSSVDSYPSFDRGANMRLMLSSKQYPDPPRSWPCWRAPRSPSACSAVARIRRTQPAPIPVQLAGRRRPDVAVRAVMSSLKSVHFAIDVNGTLAGHAAAERAGRSDQGRQRQGHRQDRSSWARRSRPTS